jgi:hypothetical protein
VVAVASEPVADYLKLAAIPRENVAEVEGFLRRQETDSNTLAVLERPDQPVALLKISAGEATLFSFLPSEGGRSLVHETYIGRVFDATITQVHPIETSVTLLPCSPRGWRSRALAWPA